jgi:carbon monoxide dehydrogenase subunit G
MAGFQLSRHVAGSPEAVFDLFSDLARAAERVSGITSLELLTDGPVGVGTRFRETRLMFGKPATEEMEVTVFERPRRYTIECHAHGTHTVSVFSLVAAGDGTDLTVDLSTTPTTLGAKLFAPIAKMFMGTMRKCIESDLDDLERHLPGAASAGA